jgi:predicted lipoprotein with Yx(FWY)xxD motif
MQRHWLTRTTLLLAALALLAACGGGRNPSDADSYAGAAPSATAPTAAVTVAPSSHGATLADSDGRTLYAFTKDQGSQSTCYGECAATWPALIEGTPAAGEGVDAALLATTSRKDGAAQVTYKGRPLYYFSGDQQPGDTNGQGIGGVWFTVTPAGELIGATADRAAGDAGKGDASYDYP